MKSLTKLTNSFFEELKAVDSSITKDELFCFRAATEKFCNSGKKSDAFVVFFCFSEIFHLFGDGYENVKKLLELLADHEYHAGELLMKHRDHYVHSAYVFALGLALYAGDEAYRREFRSFYNLTGNGFYEFLRLWGMTSLFHDIGYPFQLAHEQIKAYTDGVDDVAEGEAESNPYVSFGNLDAFLEINETQNAYLKKALHTEEDFTNFDELLAYGLEKREGYEREIVVPMLRKRVTQSRAHMDHGYFSAVLFGRRLLTNRLLDEGTLDVVTAHLLHNNFNKYDYPKEKQHRIALREHPLAYLLMLCDELQTWDRTAYGLKSKKEPLAWNIRISVSENMLDVTYVFDSKNVRDLSTAPPKDVPNVNVQKITSGKFAASIYEIVDSKLLITANVETRVKEKIQNRYASTDRFVNLCDFAAAIHASYLENCENLNTQHVRQAFGNLSLELKISNIEQAKSYAEKLELINCFYSDKDLDYPVVEQFEGNIDEATNERKDDFGFLCREEHLRWVKEKLNMGWKYGTSYISETGVVNYALRQQKKEHKDIVPFECLTREEQEKDAQLIRNMIPFLYKHGGNIRIYRYRYGRKPDLNIAAIGHRAFVGDREKIKAQIKEILSDYNRRYRVIVRSCFAFGADQLIAECAAELGITLKAALPMGYEEFIQSEYEMAKSEGYPFGEEDELRMRHLLAQTAVCRMLKKAPASHLEAAKYVMNHSDKVIALWDGVETKLYDEEGNPTNRGGTYHCLEIAKNRGLGEKDIHIVSVER